MIRSLCSADYRGITADHYMDGKKYMIWYYITGNPYKTVGIVQVRGIREPLTEEELRHHIDKLWERYHKEKGKEQGKAPGAMDGFKKN